MHIIDSHVHFWDTNRLTYPWLAGETPLNRLFLPRDYAQATQKIEIAGVVFVQADCLPEQGVAEVDWVTTLEAPVQAIVGFAPLDRGEGARPYLERLQQRPLVRGVRRLLQREAVDFAVQPDFVHGVQLLPNYGFSFDICVKHQQLAAVNQLVTQCPEVQFVLDHIGKPDIASSEFSGWQKQITRLSSFPNVYCKISGVITEADWASWNVDLLRPYVDHVVDSFGMERVMFGSDWPVVNLAGSYSRWFDALLTTVDHLNENEKQQLFSTNCQNFYRINPHE